MLILRVTGPVKEETTATGKTIRKQHAELLQDDGRHFPTSVLAPREGAYAVGDLLTAGPGSFEVGRYGMQFGRYLELQRVDDALKRVAAFRNTKAA